MEPKTKIQKEVAKIQPKLKPLTSKQEEWVYAKFEKLSQIIRNRFNCLECGHSYVLNKQWESLLFKIENKTTCPVCKSVAKPHVGKLDFRRKIETFEFITTFKGWQVIRLFYGYKHIAKGQKANTQLFEVMQHWINPNGKIVSYCKPVHYLTRYIDSFVLHKDLELRHSQFKNSKQFDLSGNYLYPRVNVLPIVKRNGFNIKALKNINAQILILGILTDNKCETLIKAKQYDLLKTALYYNHRIDNIWSQIKIAIRNNYIIKNENNWNDYLTLMKELNKDLHNPKYVCPIDLHKEHQKALEKVRLKRRKIKLKKMLSKLHEENKEYIKQRHMFFDLHLKYDNLSIDVIKSVRQVYDEGVLLNHCVYENAYHKKQHSLLLSAKVNNEVVETIEVDLKNLSINQARGKDNHPSEYNELIVNLVTQNFKKIKSMYKKQLKVAA
jgi:hypothetical protein